MGNLIVGEISFQLIGALRPLMGRIRKQDRAPALALLRIAARDPRILRENLRRTAA